MQGGPAPGEQNDAVCWGELWANSRSCGPKSMKMHISLIKCNSFRVLNTILKVCFVGSQICKVEYFSLFSSDRLQDVVAYNTDHFQ